LELGWDERFGGLLLAIDIDGVEPPYWKNGDCKPWWVAVEALVATAYAYRHCGEAWCLRWHKRVRDFAFSHYPVPTGEWTPWVDRQGRRMQNAVLPVKDPFHLPRGLMHLTDVLAHL
jgi:N-acylglucosamine 2-epimerase